MSFQRGVVTLVFDDGYQSVYDNVLPLLAKYRAPAVFALPLHTAALAELKRALVPHSRWQALRQYGHEIAAHSINHQDLATLPPDQLNRELQLPAEQLKATTLVYPGGSTNDVVTAAARRYYQAARTTRRGFEDIQPNDPLQLRTFDFTRKNFSPLKANILALAACLTNRWLIETYHIVDDHETEAWHAVRLTDFERHLAFLARLPLQITTIYAHLNHQKKR